MSSGCATGDVKCDMQHKHLWRSSACLQGAHVAVHLLEAQEHLAVARLDGVQHLAKVLGVPDVCAKGRAHVDDLVAELCPTAASALQGESKQQRCWEPYLYPLVSVPNVRV